MAQIHVKDISEDVIEYEGKMYGRVTDDPKIGDLVRRVRSDRHFLPLDAMYEVDDTDEDGDPTITDEDGDAYAVYGANRRCFDVYRLLPPSTLTLPQQIEAKRAELAALEAQYADEITVKIGDYARITDETACGDVQFGDIVLIEEIERRATSCPYKARKVLANSDDAWDWVAAVEKLTPEAAKAALIAEIEALFTIKTTEAIR